MRLVLMSIFVFSLSAGHGISQGQDIEPPRGLWKTEADARGHVYHVRTKPCGKGLCGRIERVKNRRGIDTPSNAVSHPILQNLRPQSDGTFMGAFAVPGSGPVDAVVRTDGNALQLESCLGDECKTLRWKRLR